MHRISATVVGCLSVCLLAGVAFPQQAQFESLLASAQQAQARGDFAAAAEFYQQAVAVHPEIPELRANLGLMYYQSGKVQQAIEAFRQAIRLKPTLFVPHLFLGLGYIRGKQFSEAIPYLKRAAVLNSKDVQTQLSLGQAYTATGETWLAVAAYSRAVELDPNSADARLHLGITYLEEVETDARTLLARHKDSGYLHALVAETFVEQRHFVQAAEAYNTTLSHPPFPPGVHALYGLVLLSQQKPAEAEKEFNAELSTAPGSLFAKLGLAALLLSRGADEDGLKQVQEIWKTEPAFLPMNIALLNAVLPRQKRSELEQVADQEKAAGKISPEVAELIQGDGKEEPAKDLKAPRVPAQSIASPNVLFLRASKMYANGRYQECSDFLSSNFRMLGAQELLVLASCAYSVGDHSLAMEAAHKLASIPQSEAAGLYWEIKSAEKLATRSLLRASELDSTSPQLHVLLGDVYRQKMYFSDAEQEYRKALKLQPNDTGALFGLCLTMLADSDVDGALQLAQTTLQNNPEDPEINAVMGEILCARRQYAEAEPYLKKGLAAKPEYVPHVHALLGKVYAETDRTQQAVSELKLGLADDKDGRLHYQIGRLYLKLGDRNAAKQAFEVSDQMRREGLTRAAVSMRQGEVDFDSQ